MEIVEKYFFLPPDLKTEFLAQTINTRTGLVYACLVDNKLLFPLFDLCPLEGVQFHTSLPAEWINKSCCQTVSHDWLDKWTRIEGCYFDDSTTSNLILFYREYSFSLPIKSSKFDFPSHPRPFALNFSTENELKEFEEDVLFTNYLTRAVSYLHNNRIPFTIVVSPGEFENLYRFLLTKLKEQKYALSSDILRGGQVVYVRDSEMQQRLEYFLKLRLLTFQAIFYREEPLEEEINEHHIEKKILPKVTSMVTEKNLIKTYINTTDLTQFLKHRDEIYVVKKLLNFEGSQLKSIYQDEGLEKIHTVDEFREERPDTCVIFYKPSYFFVKKVVRQVH